MKKKLSTLGSILFYLGLFVVLIGAIMFAKSTRQDKSIFGYRFYEVLSGSMEPTIKVGELVIIKMIDPQDMKVGDIITKSIEENGSITLTHRLIDIYKEDGSLMFQTQGDNNDTPDDPIPAEAAIGVVVTHIPYIGYVVTFIKENPFTILLLLVALGIIGTSLKILLPQKSDLDKMVPPVLEAKAAELEDQALKLRELAKRKRMEHQIKIDHDHTKDRRQERNKI